jgi:hypothetical protein
MDCMAFLLRDSFQVCIDCWLLTQRGGEADL